HIAALIGLASALLLAIGVYGMPVNLAGIAALFGGAFGLFPIGWIVLNAIFVYDITVATGKFTVVKDTIAGLASDRRIQVRSSASASARSSRARRASGRRWPSPPPCSSASVSGRCRQPASL
ncbi:MAG TPA: L-lactate permease, partial [Myxococcales bacterium]|nr:L-lactate permease [Myxococcales bacterium]